MRVQQHWLDLEEGRDELSLCLRYGVLALPGLLCLLLLVLLHLPLPAFLTGRWLLLLLFLLLLLPYMLSPLPLLLGVLLLSLLLLLLLPGQLHPGWGYRLLMLPWRRLVQGWRRLRKLPGCLWKFPACLRLLQQRLRLHLRHACSYRHRRRWRGGRRSRRGRRLACGHTLPPLVELQRQPMLSPGIELLLELGKGVAPQALPERRLLSQRLERPVEHGSCGAAAGHAPQRRVAAIVGHLAEQHVPRQRGQVLLLRGEAGHELLGAVGIAEAAGAPVARGVGVRSQPRAAVRLRQPRWRLAHHAASLREQAAVQSMLGNPQARLPQPRQPPLLCRAGTCKSSQQQQARCQL